MSLVINLLVAGALLGTLYGLVAVPLTLMLRSTGILSFAHAGFALTSAYLYAGLECPKSSDSYQQCAGSPTVPPIIAAVLAVVAAVVLALLVERLVARPLERASVATKVIATAAVLGLISGVLLQIYGPQPRYVPPEAQILPQGRLTFGSIVISLDRLTILFIAAGLVGLLAVFLRTSWFGLGIRAAGQLPDVSRLMGVRPVAISRFNWALGGLLAGLAGVLIGPVTVVNIGTFSFLLVKATAATLIGGLVSLPLTFVGGAAIGAVEAVVPHYWAAQGSGTVAVAALALTMLVLHRKRFTALGYAGPTLMRQVAPGAVTVALAKYLCALRRALAAVPAPLRLVLAVALLIVPLRSSYWASLGVNGLYYCLAGLSVVVLTGTTGQLTFMQAGFSAVGAFGLATALHQGWPLVPSLLLSLAVCAVVGAIAGWLSLRFRGLEFAIASLALGAVLTEFIVTRPGIRTDVPGVSIFGRTLLDSRNLYGFVLIATALFFLVVYNLRSSGWGMSLRAMQALHSRVAHFGVAPLRSEVALLSLSATVAGLAGCVLALIVVTLDPFLFVPVVSVTIVLVAVVGGLSSLWGPVLAGLVFGFGQELVGRAFSGSTANAFPQIASAGLALFMVIRLPGGLASIFSWAEDVVRAAPEQRLHFRSGPVRVHSPALRERATV